MMQQMIVYDFKKNPVMLKDLLPRTSINTYVYIYNVSQSLYIYIYNIDLWHTQKMQRETTSNEKNNNKSFNFKSKKSLPQLRNFKNSHKSLNERTVLKWLEWCTLASGTAHFGFFRDPKCTLRIPLANQITYPAWWTYKKAIENGHRNSWFTH
jgi:hypothetical protein